MSAEIKPVVFAATREQVQLAIAAELKRKRLALEPLPEKL